MKSFCLSQSFIVRMTANGPVGMNELVGVPVRLTANFLTILISLREPKKREHIIDAMLSTFGTDFDAESALYRILDAGLIIDSSGELAKKERVFQSSWPYGMSTASHALALDRVQFKQRDSEIEYMASVMRNNSSPKSSDKGALGSLQTIPLPRGWADTSSLFGYFASRRSARKFNDLPMSSENLSMILASGLAIIDYLELPYRPLFPLRYTPSPGGLASVSGYLILRSVHGVPTGVYRYDPELHAIECISLQPNHAIHELFGHQIWASQAAVMIVLVADLKKIAWKYHDPGAYNASLLEAGHIAQNMAITASSLGLSSIFTNAMSAESICRALNISWPSFLPIYSIGIGDSKGIENAADEYEVDDIHKLRELMVGESSDLS